MHRPPAEAVVNYEIACLCGRPLRGPRQRSQLIISCPSCGRKHFIFPISPWLPPAPAAIKPAGRLNLNRLLLGIVIGGALSMALVFLLLRPYLRRPEAGDASTAPADSHALLAEGERQLREGNVFLALKQLRAGLDQYSRHPQSLSRNESYRLKQLWRQTDLLAHLLDQPLEEILHQAMQHRSDEDWDTKFQHYRGRTLVFDDVLRRDAQGRPILAAYLVRAGDTEARVALEDLTLLRQLPLDPPRRWLFGVRLADCRREHGGIWVFRFEPDSVVLLSDEIAAAVCCPHPLDEELLAVLKRQDEWLQR
jgi:hypothetical protein